MPNIFGFSHTYTQWGGWEIQKLAYLTMILEAQEALEDWVKAEVVGVAVHEPVASLAESHIQAEEVEVLIQLQCNTLHFTLFTILFLFETFPHPPFNC